MSIDIKEIAKEMASKYCDSELGWIIKLKRLERQGYVISKQTVSNSTKHKSDCTCARCTLLNAARWDR